MPPDGLLIYVDALDRAKPTPQTVIEAVLHSVRERGLPALEEPHTLARLARCDQAARNQINKRIAALIALGTIEGPDA
jgi:hypothetical protein